MKERPIIFNTEMVKAILDGKKTQTRRVIKPQPNQNKIDVFNTYAGGYERQCPYGKPGDHLWVRETFAIKNENQIVYKADSLDGKHDYGFEWKWKPSIYMPRWASRIDLEITNIRVERLQDISNEDAIAEGFLEDHMKYEWEPRLLFIYKWNKINEKRGYPFKSNPWVWVIEFKVL